MRIITNSAVAKYKQRYIAGKKASYCLHDADVLKFLWQWNTDVFVLHATFCSVQNSHFRSEVSTSDASACSGWSTAQIILLGPDSDSEWRGELSFRDVQEKSVGVKKEWQKAEDFSEVEVVASGQQAWGLTHTVSVLKIQAFLATQLVHWQNLHRSGLEQNLKRTSAEQSREQGKRNRGWREHEKKITRTMTGMKEKETEWMAERERRREDEHRQVLNKNYERN